MYIGTKLWKLLSNKERDENIFIIVNLIYNSLDKVICKNERTTISELYLTAGDKCLASTAFKDAYKYFNTGLALLSSDCWEKNYSLSLRLHNAAAEAAYCIDEHNDMSKILDIITIKAVSLLDKELSYMLSVQFYNDKRMFDEGFNEGIRILEKIGYKLCSNDFEKEYESTKSLVNGKLTQNYVTEMKTMSAQIPHVSVTILCKLLVSCAVSKPHMTPLVALRIVQLTFLNGATKYSALGFVFFGNSILMKDPKDMLGYECAEFAQLLLKKVPAKDVSATVFLVFHLLFSPRSDHVHNSLEPILKSRRKFLEIGSIGNSILCVDAYLLYAFHSGKSLEELENEFKSLNEELPQKPLTYSTIKQAVLNLSGIESNDPGILIGTAFDCRSINQGKKNPSEIILGLIQCIFVSYLFQDYSAASKYIEKCRPFLKKNIVGIYFYSIHILYDGLVALILAKQSKEDKLLLKKIAENSISQLKNMSETAPENYRNKLHLLEAEMAAAFADELNALAHYRKSISLSKEHCFLHEEALACERAGMYFLGLNSQALAVQFLERSFECYEGWGAYAKLKHLKSKYPDIFKEKNYSFSFNFE